MHEMYLPVDAPPSYLVAHLGDEEYYDALTTYTERSAGSGASRVWRDIDLADT